MPKYSLKTDCTNKSKNDMNRQKHLSIQRIGKGWGQSPFGVILSALAECEDQDMSIFEKAIHIDNALAIFVRDGYEIKFYPDEDAMLIFKKPSE